MRPGSRLVIVASLALELPSDPSRLTLTSQMPRIMDPYTASTLYVGILGHYFEHFGRSRHAPRECDMMAFWARCRRFEPFCLTHFWGSR